MPRDVSNEHVINLLPPSSHFLLIERLYPYTTHRYKQHTLADLGDIPRSHRSDIGIRLSVYGAPDSDLDTCSASSVCFCLCIISQCVHKGLKERRVGILRCFFVNWNPSTWIIIAGSFLRMGNPSHWFQSYSGRYI